MGQFFVAEQVRGSAGAMPPPLPGPVEWPMVGAVTPCALANVTLPYVMPSQPQAQLSSPDMKGDGRFTHLPTALQSTASQYSVDKQSSFTDPHVHELVMPLLPSPDGSGPPKIEVHPALRAITKARANRPQRFVPDASGGTTGALPVAPSFPRRRRFILGLRAT